MHPALLSLHLGQKILKFESSGTNYHPEMKKRIFIAIHYLEIGGAEISLIGLLQSIDYSRYDVDLFVFSHRGEFMDLVPPSVNVLPENKVYACLEVPVSEALLRGHFLLAFRRVLAKLRYRSYCRRHPVEGNNYPLHHIIAETVLPVLPSLKKYGQYDMAISFLQPHNYVLEKVDAKKKICWIHTDYSSIGTIHEDEERIWGGYDNIISISEAVSESFRKAFPSLGGKLVIMHNILSREFVETRSSRISQDIVRGEMPKEKGVLNLLSVGRFCEAKNYDNVPDICRRIIENGCEIKWFLIGYGSDENLIREKIAEAKMENNVIILGKKSNPYPYIKACDIYVQPSRYEGNSVTVREAQILCRPVAITNYSTAHSQVEDGVDGVIVPLDNAACARELAAFLKDVDKIGRITEEISRRDYTNRGEVNVLEKLID